MPSPSNRSIRIFLGLFILIGVGALGGGVWTLIRSLRCEHWPTTEGVIEQAELKYHSSDHGSGSYSASITYDYQVAGVHYPGTRLAFGEMSSSSGYAQGILDRFPVGKKVRVYYSPDVPQLAVLETGWQASRARPMLAAAHRAPERPRPSVRTETSMAWRFAKAAWW